MMLMPYEGCKRQKTLSAIAFDDRPWRQKDMHFIYLTVKGLALQAHVRCGVLQVLYSRRWAI